MLKLHIYGKDDPSPLHDITLRLVQRGMNVILETDDKALLSIRNDGTIYRFTGVNDGFTCDDFGRVIDRSNEPT